MEFSKGKSMPTGKGADPLRRPRTSAASVSDGQAVKSGSPEVRGQRAGKRGANGGRSFMLFHHSETSIPFPLVGLLSLLKLVMSSLLTQVGL